MLAERTMVELVGVREVLVTVMLLLLEYRVELVPAGVPLMVRELAARARLVAAEGNWREKVAPEAMGMVFVRVTVMLVGE
jgi:hypothetical protein